MDTNQRENDQLDPGPLDSGQLDSGQLDSGQLDSGRSGTARPQAYARAALALGLVLLGLWTLQEFLPALAWACVFAIALWPLYQRAERRWPPGHHNLLLPLVFTLGIALLFVAPLALIGMQVAREAHDALNWVHDAQQNGIQPPDFLNHLPWGSQQATTWWSNNLSQPGGAQELAGHVNRTDVVSFSRRFGAQLLHRLVLFGFTLLTLFVLFREARTVTAQILVASHRAFGERGERVGRQMIASVHGTVNGLVLVGLGEGVVLGIAYVVAGVPHPALLGAFTAVAATIPFGAPLAFGVAALLLLAQGSAVAAGVIVVLGFAVSFAADHFVRPVLIGGATRLPFIWVLFGILGGVEVWGLLGLFLGPAIMAALILLWREWTGIEPAEKGDHPRLSVAHRHG